MTTHQAKVTSAGSIEGNGDSRGLLRRAFATRGARDGSKGSGAPLGRRLSLRLIAGLAVIGLLVTAASASAATEPKVKSVSEVSYDSAFVLGKITSGPGLAFGAWETSTDGGASWQVNQGISYFGPTQDQPFETTLTGLKGGTTYQVRMTVLGVTSPGPNLEFITLQVDPPENVFIGAPAKIFSLSGELSGKLKRPANPNAAFDVNCRFEYISDSQFNENVTNIGPEAGFEGAPQVPCEPHPVTAPGENVVTAKVTGLTASTTYHQRLVAETASPEVITKVGPNFTTQPTVEKPKVLSLGAVTEVSYRTAKISGVVERPAGADPALDTLCRFEVVTEEQFQATGFEGAGGPECDQTAPLHEGEPQRPITATGPTPVTVTFHLNSGVTYHVRLAAENAAGTETSSTADTFTTLPGGEPTAAVNPNPAMGYTTVQLSGTVTRGLGPGQTEGLNVAFEYAEAGTENWAGYSEQLPVPVGAGPIAISHEFHGLSPNTEYQFRLDLTGEFNGYGQEIQPPPYQMGKTRPLTEPTIAFAPVSAITANTAHFSGSVNTNAPAGPLDELSKNAYRTEWEFQCTPECPGRSGTVQGEEGDKAISLDAHELQANTYYEAKLVAHNAFYTVETPVQGFQTPLVAPSITAAPGASDEQGGYFLEGVVNSNNAKVTSCKFEYGTTATYPNTYEAACSPSPSGPDEVQLINVDAGEGQFRLGFRGQTTADLPFDATTAEVQAALSSLSEIGSSGVDVSGAPQAYKVTFAGPLAGANVEPMTAANGTTPLGGGGGGGVSVSTETEGGNAHAVSVEAHLDALTPGATYHFRIVAISAGGTTATVDRIFVPELAPKNPPCPNEQIRKENSSLALPECRAYEQVSNPFKEGYEALLVESHEGDAVQYSSKAPNIANSGAGVAPETSPYVATRSATGWQTIPNLNGPSGSMYSAPTDAVQGSVRAAGVFFSQDLLSSMWMFSRPPEPQQDAQAYLRNPDGTFSLIGHGEPLEHFQAPYLFGASADLSHQAYAAAPSEPTTWGPGVYEFVGTGNDQPRRVDLDNEGDPASACVMRTGYGNTGDPDITAEGRAMSTDGRVIVFAIRGGCGGANPADEIWARVNGTISYDVSASRCTRVAPAEPCNAPADATFVSAARDGSRVFFTTTQQLVNGDTDQANDLYACDIPPGTPAPTGNANPCAALIEVSGAQTGAAVEKVLTTSEDGSTVYFTAKGVLASNQDALGETAQAGDRNLYVWRTDATHPAGQTKFIGALLPGDNSIGQTTPDGRYLVLQTSSQLLFNDTDNAADIYRYDADTEEMTRASTAVSGTGGNVNDFDATIAIPKGGEFPTFYYHSNPTVSNDGEKLVFRTDAPLSPLDNNGEPDLYLWNSGRVSLITAGSVHGGLSGSFATFDISGSGRDIYFGTEAELTPSDGDTKTDVYDARVDGGFSFVKNPCSGESCQPPASPTPVAPAPVTGQSPADPGNVKPCPKGKVAKGDKCVKKPQKKHHKKAHKRTGHNRGGSK